MGSGDWLKSIITGKKNQGSRLKDGKGSLSTTKTNGLKWKHKPSKYQTEQNVPSSENPGILSMPIEDIAATQIQTAFRGFRVEWYGGPETKEEIISRIQQREEAAIKRERAMAYAFCHQWRANSNRYSEQEPQESIFTNWGWSWIDHWIAVRPWEIRNPVHSISNKGQTRQATKISRNPNPSRTKTTKCSIDTKGRRSSYPVYGRIDTHVAKTKGVSSAPPKTQETSTKRE